jgi:hypothetical protein
VRQGFPPPAFASIRSDRRNAHTAFKLGRADLLARWFLFRHAQGHGWLTAAAQRGQRCRHKGGAGASERESGDEDEDASHGEPEGTMWDGTHLSM